MENKKKVYSGIRATGRLHLGNYLGAIKGMLELQDEYDCVFSVVDLHAITTPYEVNDLQQNIKDVILDFLAGEEPVRGQCMIGTQTRSVAQAQHTTQHLQRGGPAPQH